MKLKFKLQHISTPAKIYMVIIVILFLLSILQGICFEIERTYNRTKQLTAEEKPQKEISQEGKRQERIRNSAKEFLPNGTIHLIYISERISDQINQEQIYDADDNLLWEGPSNKRPYEYLSWATHLRRYSDGFDKQQMKQTRMITTDFSQNVRVPVQSDNKTKQIWRYNPDAKYFTGYNNSGEKIGYAGSTGFTDSKSKVKPFGEFGLFTAWIPKDSFSPILLWQTQRRIYRINFEKQEMELIFESTESDIEAEGTTLHAWRDLKPGENEYIDPNKYRPLIHCQTEDGKHHLILREPEQQLSLRVPRASVTATKEDIYVRSIGSDSVPSEDIVKSKELYNEWLEERRGKPRNFWTELYKVDNQGNLTLINRYDWTAPAQSAFFSITKDPRPAIKRYLSQLSPLFYDLMIRLSGRKFLTSIYSYENRGDFFYGLIQMMQEIRPHGGIMNRILSVLIMVFVFWHGWPRRTSWIKFLFWLVFAGLFNIAGLLTYLALNHTTVIKCPTCGKRRGLAQVDCVRCHEELPAPEHGKLDLIFSI